MSTMRLSSAEQNNAHRPCRILQVGRHWRLPQSKEHRQQTLLSIVGRALVSLQIAIFGKRECKTKAQKAKDFIQLG